jgi:hypothetical protein
MNKKSNKVRVLKKETKTNGKNSKIKYDAIFKLYNSILSHNITTKRKHCAYPCTHSYIYLCYSVKIKCNYISKMQ